MKQYMLLLFIFVTSVFADDSLFKQGNEEYQNGNYEKALAYYQQILTDGQASPSLYFNMGNCYFKLNQLGQSIVYYEKAKRLAPLDQDVIENLKLANKEVIDHIEIPEQMFIFDLYQQFIYSFTVNDFLMLCLYIFFIGLAAQLYIKFSQGRVNLILQIVRNASIILFVLFAIISYIRLEDLRDNYAILIVKQTEVYTSPDTDAQAFILHEGAKFQINREVNNRLEIELLDGKTGWINRDDAVSI